MTEAEGLKEERLKFSGKSGGKLGNAMDMSASEIQAAFRVVDFFAWRKITEKDWQLGNSAIVTFLGW